MLGVKYILSYEKIEDVPQYEHIYTAGNVYVHQNTATEGIGKFYSKVISYDNYLELDEVSKEDILSDTLILQDIDDSYCGEANVEESEVLFKKPDNSSFVIGEIEAKQDGYVFVAIPFENGWKAYVDGVETEILQADIGYSAIRVEKGYHDISFKYNTPFLKEGMFISLVGVVCFIGWSMFLYQDDKKKMLKRQ